MVNTGSAGRSYTHTGLTPGTTRYYRVAAINARGTGAFSSVATGATNAGPPAAPQNLRANANGPTTITIAWDAPNDNGARITGYRIRVRLIDQADWTTVTTNTGSTATTFQHINLQPATSYRYQVAAINSEGAGPWSADAGAITPADVPAPPTNLSARPMGTSQIDLSWRAPINTGGAAIIGYRIEVSADGGNTWTILRRNTGSTTPSFSHTNLQPASTRFYRVSAINLAGTGRPSNVARATTEATVPNAPRTLSATANGTSQIDLSWDLPSTNGGAVITGYRDRGVGRRRRELADSGGRHARHFDPVHARRPRSRLYTALSGIGDQSRGRGCRVEGRQRHHRRHGPRCAHRTSRHGDVTDADRPCVDRARVRRRCGGHRLPDRGLGGRAPAGATCGPTPAPPARRSRTRTCSPAAGDSTGSRRSTGRARGRRRRSLRPPRTIPSSARGA